MVMVMNYTKPTDAVNPNEYVFTLFAETKEEVTENMKVVGMRDNAIIAVGSSVYTASGDVAFRKQDRWKWV